ncbi:MAG: DUF1360 domain-containing protein [Chloroflexota bacterium]
MRSRPYWAYALVITSYWALFGGMVSLIRRSGKQVPEGFSLAEIIALGLATFRLSRTATYDRVTAVVRLPFVDPNKGPIQPEGTRGMPKGSGLQLSLGQLFT